MRLQRRKFSFCKFCISGFDQSEFCNVFASHEQVERIVADRRIRAVKYTGGNEGGNKIAALAGKHMKKGTFELGGNDAFIVLQEANLEKAVQAAFKSRMTCNA